LPTDPTSAWFRNVAWGTTERVLVLRSGAAGPRVPVDVNGRDRVHSDLAREQIVGTPDSTIPGQKVDTGKEAEAFAATIRKHTLESTGGPTYSETGYPGPQPRTGPTVVPGRAKPVGQ
jgi:hypothetical protein